MRPKLSQHPLLGPLVSLSLENDPMVLVIQPSISPDPYVYGYQESAMTQSYVVWKKYKLKAEKLVLVARDINTL